MNNEYREIDPYILERIEGNVWSMENMEGHGAAGRSLVYIGSRISGYLDNDRQKGQLIYDYYKDSANDYWFKNRALLPNGAVVSMEFYIFGRELKYMRHIRRKS